LFNDILHISDVIFML